MPDLVIVLVVILVLVLLWRGPRTLPQLGEALGRGVKEARTAARDDDVDAGDRRAETHAHDGHDHDHPGHDHDHAGHDHPHGTADGDARRD